MAPSETTSKSRPSDAEQRRLEKELIKSFAFYADPAMTGYDPPKPIGTINFCAMGDQVGEEEQKLDFMGHGKTTDGYCAFEATGGFDLRFLLELKEPGQLLAESKAFQAAVEMVRAGLEAVARSPQARALPGDGPISFELSLADQVIVTLGRLHRDGKWEPLAD